MSRIRLVVFDVAGTIIEDHGEVVHCFRHALEQNGFHVSEEELREWKGASKREVIQRFVTREGHDQATAEKTYGDFRRLLEYHYQSQGVTPIAGAERTFSWLREHDIKLATTTGFYREVNDLILGRAGWQGRFDANISSNDVMQGRPAPFMIFRAMEAAGVISVSEVMNVGDTPLDLQAGTNAGVAEVVGVLSGLHQEDRLRREPHTHIIQSVAEVPGLIGL